jgi:hypothetical protein
MRVLHFILPAFATMELEQTNGDVASGKTPGAEQFGFVTTLHEPENDPK